MTETARGEPYSHRAIHARDAEEARASERWPGWIRIAFILGTSLLLWILLIKLIA